MLRSCWSKPEQREQGLPPSHELEAAWAEFYDLCARKIRAYASACGAAQEDMADCTQEVWRELLVRLPRFQLDPCRGQFDTWLYSVVRSKTADLGRSRKRRSLQERSDILQNAADSRPTADQALEAAETVAVALEELSKKSSECTYQVLQLRLVDERPVAEVARRLGLSHEQVWYRYHRARRALGEIGSGLALGRLSRRVADGLSPERDGDRQQFAQGKASVSVSIGVSTLGSQGGNFVDHVFRRLELGRRELIPEWKVEWNCDAVPRPVLYIRKLALVACAEICGPEDGVNPHWARIVNASISAGVAAGIATIIATPTAALPVFQAEFHKQLQSKGASAGDQKIQVALSATLEPDGPWCMCKG
jgi:RNA polymerase sigma factor (sigma-70 family)